MWVNSRVAAEILAIKYDALVKAVKRAEKSGKKFCSIKPNILGFMYIDGIGRGGRTLQIWIDESIYPEIVERISKTREGESYDVPYNAASGAKSGKGAGADDEGADELGRRDGANANGDRRASNGAKEAGESEYALKDSCLKYSLKGASIEYQTLIFYFASPNDQAYFNNNLEPIKANLREFWKIHAKEIKQNGIYFTDVIAKLAQKEPKKQMNKDLANLFDQLREAIRARDEL